MIRFDCALQRPGFRFNAAFTADAGITALFGPSGAGKTTAIRLLAGLERPDSGQIVVDGRVLADTAGGVFVKSHHRRVGLVYQDAQLFPHLSVRSNLLYGWHLTPPAERRITLASVVEALGIGHLLDRQPLLLSGGERQRVAIGRALLATPRLLLMDEPLASLDAARKREILPLIERMRDDFAIPVVYVSHAVAEVARLADRVVQFEDGAVVTSGTPGAVFSQIAPGEDRFAIVSLLSATVLEHQPTYGVSTLAHPAGLILAPGLIAAPGKPVRLVVRATDVTLAIGDASAMSTRTALAGTIVAIAPGSDAFALVSLALAGGDMLRASVTRHALAALALREGDAVRALVKTVAIDEASIATTV